MFWFWIMAGMMIVFAVGMLVLPLWRGGQSPGGRSHEATEVALYRQRRAEIARDRAAGVLSDAEYQRVQAELDQQLLVDTGDAGPSAGAQVSHATRWPIAVVVVVLPLVAIGLYAFLGGPSAVFSRHAGVHGVPPNMQAMVARLAERLEAHPDNGRGWLMLGRSYLVLEQPRQAVRALTRAHQQLGDKPAVLLTLARALAATRKQPSLLGRPAKLINKASAKAPNNAEALWLAGLVAVERGDYETAVKHWRALLSRQGPDSRIADRIRTRLADLRARMAHADGDASAPKTGMQASGGDIDGGG